MRYRRTFKQAQSKELYPEPPRKTVGPRAPASAGVLTRPRSGVEKKPFPFQKKATEQELEELQKRREPENIQLFQYTKDVLMDLAKKANIIGRSTMNKGQLITALSTLQNLTSAVVEESKQAVVEEKKKKEEKLESKVEEAVGNIINLVDLTAVPANKKEAIQYIQRLYTELGVKYPNSNVPKLSTSTLMRKSADQLDVYLDELRNIYQAEVFREGKERDAQRRAINALRANVTDEQKARQREERKTEVERKLSMPRVREERKVAPSVPLASAEKQQRAQEQLQRVARTQEIRREKELEKKADKFRLQQQLKRFKSGLDDAKWREVLRLVSESEMKENEEYREQFERAAEVFDSEMKTIDAKEKAENKAIRDAKAKQIAQKANDKLRQRAFEVFKEKLEIRRRASEVITSALVQQNRRDTLKQALESKVATTDKLRKEEIASQEALKKMLEIISAYKSRLEQTSNLDEIKALTKTINEGLAAMLPLVSSDQRQRLEDAMKSFVTTRIRQIEDEAKRIADELIAEEEAKTPPKKPKPSKAGQKPKPSKAEQAMRAQKEAEERKMLIDVRKDKMMKILQKQKISQNPYTKEFLKGLSDKELEKRLQVVTTDFNTRKGAKLANIPKDFIKDDEVLPPEPEPEPEPDVPAGVPQAQPQAPLITTPAAPDVPAQVEEGDAVETDPANSRLNATTLTRRAGQQQPPTTKPAKAGQPQQGTGKEEKFGIDNHTIDEFLSKYGSEYLGCIAHDEIPSKIYPKVRPRSRGFFVINTDPSWKGGEHWQCIFYDARPSGSGSIEFYDSFADPIDKKLQEDLKGIAERLDAKTYLKLKENRVKQQHDDSDNCGYFCMNFITSRMRGKPFTEASGFDESVKGENDIHKFKKQNGFGFLPSFGSISTGLRNIAQGAVKAVSNTAQRVRNVGQNIAQGAQNIKEQIFFPEKKLPSIVQPTFEKYKNFRILSAQLRREPILAFVDKFINLISFGKFNQAKKDLGYDKMFHLSLILQLENGPKLLVEKNERINMTTSFKDGPQVQYSPPQGVLTIPGNPTLGEFYDKTLKAVGDHQFFTYNAFQQNCQAFIADLLRSNGALTPEAQTFVMQDAQTVIKQLPFYVSKIAQFATDTAGRVRQFFGFGHAGAWNGSSNSSSKKIQRRKKFQDFMNKIKKSTIYK